MSADGVATGVPSDGWGQLLIYRKDVFDEAGLEAPQSVEDIRAAAEQLNGRTTWSASRSPPRRATASPPRRSSTSRSPIGCQLVDDAGKVTFDSPECADALAYYADLVNNYSVDGRAGRRHHARDLLRRPRGDDALVAVPARRHGRPARRHQAVLPPVQEEPAYLAKNSGLVGPLTGSAAASRASSARSRPSTSGSTRNTEAAQELVEYMMTDGYVRWLGPLAAGQVPGPLGHRGGPEEFIDGVGRAGERRRHEGAAEQVLLAGVDRLARRGRAEHSSAGASPRARVRWSARCRASSPSPPRSSEVIGGKDPGGGRQGGAGDRRGDPGRAGVGPWRPGPGRGCRRPRRRRARVTRARRDSRAGLALVSPTVIVVLVMVVLPVLWALVLSFQRIRLLRSAGSTCSAGSTRCATTTCCSARRASSRPRARRSSTPSSGRRGDPLGLAAALLVRRSFPVAAWSAACCCCRGWRRWWRSPSSGRSCSRRSSGSSTRWARTSSAGLADPVPEPGARERSPCSGSASACRPR